VFFFFGWGKMIPFWRFFTFSKEYVELLRTGGPCDRAAFCAYFEQYFCAIKASGSKDAGSETVEDLRQGTFIRVIAASAQDGGYASRKRFGSPSLKSFLITTFTGVLPVFNDGTTRWRRLYMDSPTK